MTKDATLTLTLTRRHIVTLVNAARRQAADLGRSKSADMAWAKNLSTELVEAANLLSVELRA